MRAFRTASAIGLMAVLAATVTAAPAFAGPGLGPDITGSANGRAKIKIAADSFQAQGDLVSEADLTATLLGDGDVLVLRKDFKATKTADGIRVVTPDASKLSSRSDSAGTSVTAATAGSWTLLSSRCFGALFRGVSHMDACYKTYKMASDGDGSKDYWRLDWKATMFAEGRTLDWGWIHADRDAGPALSFVDWSPDADVWQGCGSYGLSISVAGVGGGFSATFCELNDISKSAGGTVGWFKDYWDWNVAVPIRDRDRSVAMLVGASSPQGTGTPTWGLSWNFAAH